MINRYPYLPPPQPVTKRRIVSSKDETMIDETTGTRVTVPVEERDQSTPTGTEENR